MKTVQFDDKALLAYTETTDGNIDYRFSPKKEVKTNRDKIFTTLSLTSGQVIEGQQIHSNRILALNAENSKMWRGMNVTGVDGFVTDQADIALMVRVADCVPVMVFDPEKKAIGLVHAGWKGAVGGIHLNAIAELEKRYESNVGDIKVWLGPCIEGSCFLSKEEPDQVSDKAWQPFITKVKSQWSIDIAGFIKASLLEAGIKKSHLTSTAICTLDTPELYSHAGSVKDPSREGRFAVIAKINE